MAAEWFIFKCGAFRQMTEWENNVLETAVKEGNMRFPLAWKFKHGDENFFEIVYEIDMIAMTETETQTGTVRRLMRLADGTSHTATSPFRPPV